MPPQLQAPSPSGSCPAPLPCRQSGALAACLTAYQRALPLANSGSSIAGLVRAAADAVGDSLPSAGPPLAFYQHNFTTIGGRQCSTLHTVVRPQRGDGSEGFVLLMPFNAGGSAASSGAHTAGSAAAALSAAAGVATAAHLRGAAWLAKDAVLVFADTGCAGIDEGAQVWHARRCT